MAYAETSTLLLTERVDQPSKSNWGRRIGWALFDLSAFAIVILFFG